MAIRIIDLRQVGPPTPPAVSNLEALKPARANHLHQILSAQDRPVGAARRVVLEGGLRGASDNVVPETDPASGATSTHADAVTPYIAYEGRAFITQGSLLRFTAHFLPAGAAQKFESPNYVPDGRPGVMRVESSWAPRAASGASTRTTSHDYSTPSSGAQYGAAPTGEESAFVTMTKLEGQIYPPEALTSMAAASEIGAGLIQVTLTISLFGGARLVDLCVYEDPAILAIDDDEPGFPAHVYSSGGAPKPGYPYAYPQEGPTSGDDRFSLTHMVESARSMPGRLGPCIWSWSAGSDDDAMTDVVSFGSGTGIDQMVSRVVTNTNYELLTRPGLSQNGSAPGASMRCGIYGRDYAQSGEEHILKTDGVVRVLVSARVEHRATSTSRFSMRVETLPWSGVTLSLASVTPEAPGAGWSWIHAVGWLSCGKHPEDDRHLWCSVKVDVGTWAVAAVSVHHLPEPA